MLGLAFFVLFTLLWSAVTFSGFVSKTFLADPWMMLTSGLRLLTEYGFAKDIGMTVWRVLGGFVIAAILVARFHPVPPVPVLSMLPALMGIDRVVATMAGLK